jgi:tetrahydromethanopterin S-methyltransferase subunit E
VQGRCQKSANPTMQASWAGLVSISRFCGVMLVICAGICHGSMVFAASWCAVVAASTSLHTAGWRCRSRIVRYGPVVRVLLCCAVLLQGRLMSPAVCWGRWSARQWL